MRGPGPPLPLPTLRSEGPRAKGSRQEGKGQTELGAAGSREGQEHTGPTWAPLPL